MKEHLVQRVVRKHRDFHFTAGPQKYEMTCPRSVRVYSRLWERIKVDLVKVKCFGLHETVPEQELRTVSVNMMYVCCRNLTFAKLRILSEF